MLMAVRPSPRRDKKLVAIFDVGGRPRSVHFGARGYGDYTTYWKASPKLARQKREQYIQRHGATETWSDPTTPATLSRYILWERPTVKAAVAAFRRRFRRVTSPVRP